VPAAAEHPPASDAAWPAAAPSYLYKKNKLVRSFGELLDNVFRPLFEATLDPASNPDLASFLEHVVGFDSVDDESKPEPEPHTVRCVLLSAPARGPCRPVAALPTTHCRCSCPIPSEWTSDENPSYSYWSVLGQPDSRARRRVRGQRRLCLTVAGEC
jgi:hypothetical protein